MKTNPLAVASLVASLLMCFFGFNSVVAIGLGFIALGQIKRRPDLYTGAGLARIGIALGILGIGTMISCGVSIGSKIQTTKPLAAKTTQLLVAGDIDAAAALFTEEKQGEPAFKEELAQLHRLLSEQGELTAFTSGWNVSMVNERTEAKYVAHFSDSKIEVSIAAVKGANGQRLEEYSIKSINLPDPPAPRDSPRGP